MPYSEAWVDFHHHLLFRNSKEPKKSDILYHAINMMGAARYYRDGLRGFSKYRW